MIARRMDRFTATHLIVALLIWTLAVAPASAQETVATDRPGLGFNPATLAGGTLQLELGTPDLEYSGTDDDPTVGLTAAFRYGLTDRVEARLSTHYAARTPAAAGTDGPTGLAGLRAGVKVAILRQPDLTLALIPEMGLPVGREALVGERASYTLNAVAGIPLGSAALTLVAGTSLDPTGGAGDDYDTTGLFAGVLSASLMDALSAFVELGALPGPGADAAYAGLGAAWLASRRIQLDSWADFGLTDAASDALFGAGISFLVR